MILLKSCYHILTPEGRDDLSGADILIRGNRIERIARSIDPGKLPSEKGSGAPDGKQTGKKYGAERAPDEEIDVIDCSHMVVLPGFVNTHHHFYQTLTRNLKAVQNAKLFEWLVYLYEVWKGIDADAVFYSTLLAAGSCSKRAVPARQTITTSTPGDFRAT